MASQFEKRKSKSTESVAQEIISKRSEKRASVDEPDMPIVVSEPEAPVYNQTGFDIFSSDNGKTYGVAEIEYNPETGRARVKDTFSITRLIALSYGNQKVALQTLKKGKK